MTTLEQFNNLPIINKDDNFVTTADPHGSYYPTLVHTLNWYHLYWYDSICDDYAGEQFVGKTADEVINKAVCWCLEHNFKYE